MASHIANVPCSCSSCCGKLVPAHFVALHRARDRRQQSIQALSDPAGGARMTLSGNRTVVVSGAPPSIHSAVSTPPAVDRRETLSRISLVSRPAPSRLANVQPTIPTRRSGNDINADHIIPIPNITRATSPIPDQFSNPLNFADEDSPPDSAVQSPMDIVSNEQPPPDISNADKSLPPSDISLPPHIPPSFLPMFSFRTASSTVQPLRVGSSSAGPPSMALHPSDTHTRRSLTRSSPTLIAQAEIRGLEHVRRAEQEARGPLMPIADDDWELRGDDTDEGEARSVGQGQGVPVPEFNSNENNVDPFQYTPQSVRPPPTAAEVHPNSAVYILYLLVFWMHTQFHLPFRACSAFLTVVALAFEASGTPMDPPMFTTLPSVINHLDAEPTFKVCPVCPKCFEPHPPSTPPDAYCNKCCHPLFHPAPTSSRKQHTPNRRPYLQYPMKSLEEQISDLLAVPGVEDELDAWRRKDRVPGEYTDIFDGNVCKELPGYDGKPFFLPDQKEVEDGELRVGVSLGVDWFSYLRSQISASHTSGPMSFNVVNLPPYLRYRTSNLLLAGILPGPKELSGDEVQPYVRILVDQLLRLWKHGIKVKTRKYPLGRLLRLVLVALVCDKPAAHKLGGFGSHCHHFFCTRCWAEQELKATPAAFAKNGFRPRTDTEHREHQRKYQQCSTKAARAQFIKEFATRFSELSRLPYFDMCRVIVIDPMHNLYLGVVKTHFYHIWVQHKILRKTKELRRLHAILSELSMPARLGRLPNLIGEPAGGSLTADQWFLFATVVAPLAIPQIWQDYMDNDSDAVIQQRIDAIATTIAAKRKAAQAAAAARKAAAELATQVAPAHIRPAVLSSTAPQQPSRPHREAHPDDAAPLRRSGRSRRVTARAEEMDIDPDEENGVDAGAVDEINIEDIYDPHMSDSDDDNEELSGRTANKRRRKAKNSNVEDEAQDAAAPGRLHPRDPGNFLKFCAALKIFASRKITESQIEEADGLIREYCLELVELYGPSVIRPNHHYAIHIPECIRDYGPLIEFWTFLFERMNKVLKSYKTSNHAGGELETSFFREFQRTVRESRLLAQGLQEPPESEVFRSVTAMYKASADDRGTIQALSRELDEAHEDENVTFQLSTRSTKAPMPHGLYYKVLTHLQTRLPNIELHSHIALAPSPTSIPLPSQASFFDHVILDQERYVASSRAVNAAGSLVAVRTSSHSTYWVGELRDIFVINQPVIGIRRFGWMRWFRHVEFDISDSIWAQFASLQIDLWQTEQYLDKGENMPEELIDLSDIFSHVVRHTVTIGEETCWATIVLRQIGGDI